MHNFIAKRKRMVVGLFTKQDDISANEWPGFWGYCRCKLGSFFSLVGEAGWLEISAATWQDAPLPFIGEISAVYRRYRADIWQAAYMGEMKLAEQ